MPDPFAERPPGDDPNRPPGEPAPPAAEDEVNLLDGSAEPTDDSPTVISRAPPPRPVPAPEEGFSGALRGRHLAHFELIEPIGVGGMAAVLRARDTQLDRLVALKILPPEMATDAENVQRFHQEARSAAKLDHENIARVFFCGEDQRLHFIAFEFVEGENLRTILERRGRLPVAEAVHYMLQVAAGLAHAARRGVVHRDIKPSNIIITPNGRAKLVDMGLARSLGSQPDRGLTHSGVTLGTFDYISPEQALEPRDADVRSDIYSLGCTFYHMLTGQPPVPEGTAAKKLHHHQHVRPPDPRQFVPDLPDDVAFILDRMMAKQPRDRYQSPEQLVHHLLLVARKLGAAADIPEGVLAVEAALPNPPSGRPLLLAFVAAAAVVGLIFLLDQAPPRAGGTPEGPPPAGEADRGKPAADDKAVIAPPTRPPEADPRPAAVAPTPVAEVPRYRPDRPTAADLARFLEENKNAPEVIIELAGDLDLSASDEGRKEQGLLVANPRVTIRARDPGRVPTIRFRYEPELDLKPVVRAPLTILGRECVVERVRFVLDLRGAYAAMAGLLFRGSNPMSHRVSRCEFVQAQAPLDRKNRLASVLVDATSPSSLSLEGCCFVGFGDLKTAGADGPLGEPTFSGTDPGGQDAVARRGPVSIRAGNCAFGPHLATFRLEGAAGAEEGRLEVSHCSVLAAGQSAVFVCADGADARIRTRFCLFSHPGESRAATMSSDRGAFLLRQTASPGVVSYEGHANRYHRLDGYWVVADAPDDADWDDFQKRLREARGKDDSPEALEGTPWLAGKPLDLLAKDPVAAFRVNPRLAELRPPPGGEDRLIGAERLLAVSYVDHLPKLDDKPARPATRRELVVDGKGGAGQRTYRTLAAAVLEAGRGDVILLRVDGELKLQPVLLNKASLSDLTIRAADGFRPVLTLETSEVDAALFRVHDGRLRLENLEVRLRPDQAFDVQALVAFAGDGECVLDNCLITLDRAGQKTSLAVAVVAAPGTQMKVTMPSDRPRDKGPRFAMDRCLVRGEGDLVWGRSGRPAEVDVKNSLVALSGGSVVNVEAGNPMPESPAGPLALRLSRVTAYLTGNLLRVVAGKELRDLARIKCEVSECLLLPAGGARALVHLEGAEADEDALLEKLAWEGGRNGYGGFGTMLEQQTSGVTMRMPSPWTLEKWKNYSGESDSEYGVKPAGLPAADAPFTQLVPSSFKGSDERLKGCGADLARLPVPGKERTEKK